MIFRFAPVLLAASYIQCMVTSSASSHDVIVTTPLGQIRGKRRTDVIPDINLGIDMVDIFLGVPYAEPPVNALRFSAPKPSSAWQGVTNATHRAPFCPQADNSAAEQDEDCLYLNIYSPFQNNTKTSYPVMVYIHGGSYIIGSGNEFTGHILARRGVVVVTINYRLHVLGFLSTGDKDLPGNYGIRDQIMALTWISQNIASFRGDPKQVTIFGNSAGASSVGIHLLSPLSAGLFHRAIIESGPVTNTLWAHHHKATKAMLRNYTETVAQTLNCTETPFERVVECLRKFPWKELRGVELPKLYGTPESLMPVEDGEVIPGHVEDLIMSGKVNRVPVIIGMAQDECAFLTIDLIDPTIRKEVDVNVGLDDAAFHSSVKYTLLDRYEMPNDSRFLNEAIFEYTDHKRNPSTTKELSNRDQLIQLCTDVHITAPTILLSQALSNLSMPVYLYAFDHPVQASVPAKYPFLAKTSWHQIELPFVFGAPYFTTEDPIFPLNITFTNDDKTISRYMMEFWTNFAKSGNPTPHTSKPDWSIPWPKYHHQNNSEYLFVGPIGFAVYKHFKAHRVAFWNDYVPYWHKRFLEKPLPLVAKPVKVVERNSLLTELIIVSSVCGVMLLIIVVLTILLFTQRRKAKWKPEKNDNTYHNLTFQSDTSRMSTISTSNGRF